MFTCTDPCVCKVGQVQKARLASPEPQQGKGLDTQNVQVFEVLRDLRGPLSPKHHTSPMGDGAQPVARQDIALTGELAVR